MRRARRAGAAARRPGARRGVAHDAYTALHARSVGLRTRDAFWREAAAAIDWSKPFDRVLEHRVDAKAFQLTNTGEIYQWYTGGMLNVCHNAVDRHVAAGRGDQPAVVWVSSPAQQTRTLTFSELHREVARVAGCFATHGVKKGDRVVVYMPMVVDALVTMLACARIGAVHSVVFGGMAAPELATRIDDAKPKLLVAGSGGLEQKGPSENKVIHYYPVLVDALRKCDHKPDVCLVKNRTEVEELTLSELTPISDSSGWILQPLDYDEEVERTATGAATGILEDACVPVKATDPLYILYTSGSTGAPKGVLRDAGGHAVALQWTMTNLLGISPGDVCFSTSDVGWVVGHSFIVYGPLIAGATTVLYEGKPIFPDAGVVWRIMEEHKVNTFYSAPTALRAIRAADPDLALAKKYDLSSLRGVFLAGERCDPTTSGIFAEKLGTKMYDNWWQTETGSPICGLQDDTIGTRPGSTSLPMPGYDVCVYDQETGKMIDQVNKRGSLLIRLPLPPGCFPTLWRDPERFMSYMDDCPGFYETGDSGLIDEDGYLWVLEREDDVMNCAGHRLSSGEIEKVLKAHKSVNDCAVFGPNDPQKTQVPVALVVLVSGIGEEQHDAIKAELKAAVRDPKTGIGAYASLAAVEFVTVLPKTRSGKVLRKNLRGIANAKPIKAPGTIDDPDSLDVCAEVLQKMGYPSEWHIAEAAKGDKG